jgi:hypothetical protein
MYPRLANCSTGIVAARLRTITRLKVFHRNLAAVRKERRRKLTLFSGGRDYD